jgi:cytochrome c oxidase cbb3-type subunit 4
MDLLHFAMGLRPFFLVLMTLIFAGIAWWAYSPRRRERLDTAARIPFTDDPLTDDR